MLDKIIRAELQRADGVVGFRFPESEAVPQWHAPSLEAMAGQVCLRSELRRNRVVASGFSTFSSSQPNWRLSPNRRGKARRCSLDFSGFRFLLESGAVFRAGERNGCFLLRTALIPSERIKSGQSLKWSHPLTFDLIQARVFWQ